MTIKKVKNKKEWRIYSLKVDPKTRKHKILGTFPSYKKALKRLREIEYFKRH